jgi:hypothetical protein
VIVKKDPGYGDDGAAFHPDGTPWLVRDPGYSDDGTLLPPLTVTLAPAGYSVRAAFGPGAAVAVIVSVQVQGANVEFLYDDSTHTVAARACAP